MHKLLIIHAFEKAEENLIKKGDNEPSKSRKAQELSDFIQEELKFSFGDKSLKNYFDKAIQLKEKPLDISIVQNKVLLGLCKYLNYENYEEFATWLKKNQQGRLIKVIDFIKKYGIHTLFLILFLILLSFLITKNEPKWMIWENNHYIETTFDAENFKNGFLKIYNEDSMKKFKKVHPDCNTEFFDVHRKPKVWYGKNRDGKLEYFTSPGLHPETGNTLKKITPYMINKYICPAF